MESVCFFTEHHYRFSSSCQEFLVTDLALATQSIKSYTISSLTLLSEVLDQLELPFATIILHAHSLETVLEQLEESMFRRDIHFILVGNDPVPDSVRHLNLVILRWDELEREGAQAAPIQSSTPGILSTRSSFCLVC